MTGMERRAPARRGRGLPRARVLAELEGRVRIHGESLRFFLACLGTVSPRRAADTASRSEAMRVAVGFNPRFGAQKNELRRRATPEPCLFHNSRVAPRHPTVCETAVRGLKHTATIGSSLRDEEESFMKRHFRFFACIGTMSRSDGSTGIVPARAGWKPAFHDRQDACPTRLPGSWRAPFRFFPHALGP